MLSDLQFTVSASFVPGIQWVSICFCFKSLPYCIILTNFIFLVSMVAKLTVYADVSGGVRTVIKIIQSVADTTLLQHSNEMSFHSTWCVWVSSSTFLWEFSTAEWTPAESDGACFTYWLGGREPAGQCVQCAESQKWCGRPNVHMPAQSSRPSPSFHASLLPFGKFSQPATTLATVIPLGVGYRN